jgi:antitoxin ParD1/3/4
VSKRLLEMSVRDQQRAAHGAFMREKILEALNDPRPDIPAAEVFARLRAYHEKAENGAPRNSTPS